MGTAAALLFQFALVTSPGTGDGPVFPREPLVADPVAGAGHLLIPPEAREQSKKSAWLAEKATRRDVHIGDRDLTRALAARRPAPAKQALAVKLELPPVGSRIQPVTTLVNNKTREALPLIPGQPIEERFHAFLRDHFTNQATQMDTRLIEVLANVAVKFRAARIEVVSGYRSPKYNLMLRKKGHEVARSSQHTEGQAVDFRVRGVKTMTLLKYVKSLRRGGVGYYPHSQFVHSDTGKIRFWKGS